MATRPNASKRPAAKRTAPKPKTPETPALNLSSLAVEDAPALSTNSKVGGVNLSDTPFPAALQASWDNATERKGRKYGAVKQVTVPAANVKTVERLIRASAAQMPGVGVRVAVGKPDSVGNVTVGFRAQTQRSGKADK